LQITLTPALVWVFIDDQTSESSYICSNGQVSRLFQQLFPFTLSCVVCVCILTHTAEAHLINAKLCVHERTVNDLIGSFLFPKADGGGRPVDIFAGYL
jgi:hypothetical protein